MRKPKKCKYKSRYSKSLIVIKGGRPDGSNLIVENKKDHKLGRNYFDPEQYVDFFISGLNSYDDDLKVEVIFYLKQFLDEGRTSNPLVPGIVENYLKNPFLKDKFDSMVPEEIGKHRIPR
jgi:hypothetical protein